MLLSYFCVFFFDSIYTCAKYLNYHDYFSAKKDCMCYILVLCLKLKSKLREIL